MFAKIWDTHVVHHEPGQDAIVYVDLHLIHEVTSPQAFEIDQLDIRGEGFVQRGVYTSRVFDMLDIANFGRPRRLQVQKLQQHVRYS